MFITSVSKYKYLHICSVSESLVIHSLLHHFHTSSICTTFPSINQFSVRHHSSQFYSAIGKIQNSFSWKWISCPETTLDQYSQMRKGLPWIKFINYSFSKLKSLHTADHKRLIVEAKKVLKLLCWRKLFRISLFELNPKVFRRHDYIFELQMCHALNDQNRSTIDLDISL